MIMSCFLIKVRYGNPNPFEKVHKERWDEFLATIILNNIKNTKLDFCITTYVRILDLPAKEQVGYGSKTF